MLIPNTASVHLTSSDCTIYQRDVAINSWAYDDVHIVVNEGDTIDVTLDTDLDFVISGYLLSLP